MHDKKDRVTISECSSHMEFNPLSAIGWFSMISVCEDTNL